MDGAVDDGSFENVFKQKKDEKNRTVVEAIKTKYCADMDDLTTKGLEIVFHGRPRKASESELGYLRNVVSLLLTLIYSIHIHIYMPRIMARFKELA